MKSINLLPWREQSRRKRQQQFLINLIIFLLVVILFVLLIHFLISKNIIRQQLRNELLSHQNYLLDNQINEIRAIKSQEEKLSIQIGYIKSLKFAQMDAMHFMVSLAKLVPAEIILTKIQRENRILTIGGKSRSNSAIAVFLQGLQACNYFINPVLTEIQNEPRSLMFHEKFTLQLTVKDFL